MSSWDLSKYIGLIAAVTKGPIVLLRRLTASESSPDTFRSDAVGKSSPFFRLENSIV